MDIESGYAGLQGAELDRARNETEREILDTREVTETEGDTN